MQGIVLPTHPPTYNTSAHTRTSNDAHTHIMRHSLTLVSSILYRYYYCYIINKVRYVKTKDFTRRRRVCFLQQLLEKQGLLGSYEKVCQPCFLFWKCCQATTLNKFPYSLHLSVSLSVYVCLCLCLCLCLYHYICTNTCICMYICV